jgi:hypothetical protein
VPGQPRTLTEGPDAKVPPTVQTRRILHAAKGRTMATLNGIEGILSTSQAPATIFS